MTNLAFDLVRDDGRLFAYLVFTVGDVAHRVPISCEQLHCIQHLTEDCILDAFGFVEGGTWKYATNRVTYDIELNPGVAHTVGAAVGVEEPPGA